ncbi:hypothetical protein R3P38DRAFT_189149 [Favolaschia claudopus]|uniref:F-box domain-containing protein n=1 Tax=Favolaschia claudopus TaxID=2862362 RepID=A0AAW0D3L8_9AGAR
MHRCWDIPEVVRLMFIPLAQPEPNSSLASLRIQIAKRKSLPKLARCCRAFSEPALDLLWMRQEGILNLLKCLPQSRWEMMDNGAIRFLEALEPADFDRVMFYSRRIRAIELRHVRTELLSQLSAVNLDCLLPNVRSVDWMEYSPLPLAYLQLFLGPLTTSLALGLGSNTDLSSYSSVFLWLARHHRPLAKLEVRLHLTTSPIVGCNDALADSILASIRSSQQLHTLSVPWITVPLHHHLAALPKLRILKVSHLETLEFPGDMAPDDGLSGSFPSLEQLTLLVRRLEVASNTLFRSFTHSPISDVKCIVDTAPTRQEMRDYFTALHDHLSPDCLTHLWAKFGREVGNEISPVNTTNAIIPNTLHPLLLFGHLSSVTIHTLAGFDLDDDICVAMAQAWPSLQNLSLRLPNDHLVLLGALIPNTMPRINVTALIAFAHHCPHLQRLELAVNATSLGNSDVEQSATRLPEPQEKLAFLNVLYSPIEDPPLVAQFLRQIFPALRCAVAVNRHEEENAAHVMHSRWVEVSTLLRSENS